ncbi:MAG: glycosyltransferase family 2 protein [Chitinophagaceae bacterium]
MEPISVSVVIPTCNRKERLLSLLRNLSEQSYPLQEVIIVDSGEDKLSSETCNSFSKLNIQYKTSKKSVCIQRNLGISVATSPWIFLCDDDIEIPGNYLNVLADHLTAHKDAGAVSGKWLQKEGEQWTSSYPLRSSKAIFWKYIFLTGAWGEIDNQSTNVFIRRIREYYKQKGNHITRAGWPVNTDFNGNYFICPVYSLGAALVKREWLLQSPYDEVLDRHGIGDNYGVIMGFPFRGVHVNNETSVYHHREPTNRLKRSLQYYRRILALDYYIRIGKAPTYVRRVLLVWSLLGNLPGFILVEQGLMIKATWKVIWKIVSGDNPYYKAAKQNGKVVEPFL